MRLLLPALTVSSLLLLAGCAGQAATKPVVMEKSTHTLEQTTWVLTAFDQHTIPARAPTLTLDPADKRAYGFAGCNRYFAAYTLKGDKLSLGQAGATLMACPDMTIEHPFLQALSQIDRTRLQGDTLELLQGDTLRLRFKAEAAK